jgi:peptidoglycan hydrolase CwlO-like protein
MRENPEARLLPLANKTFKDVQELRKRRAALLERGAPKESIQAVEKLITRRMQVLNDRVRAMEQ